MRKSSMEEMKSDQVDEPFVSERTVHDATYDCVHRPWGCRADFLMPCHIWLRKDMDTAGGPGLQRSGAAVSKYFQVEEQMR